ncbi:MAG: prolyl oligopeptidase family serine peptidase, partial [Gemmatimonadetes bacterium]|nr:prolyl oligopeptidase family serine peptidase [Gemmatimonadota bacterium]
TEFMKLRRYDLANQEETTLLADIPWDVSSIQLSHDGSYLLVSVNDDGRTVYYTTDPEGRKRRAYSPFDAGSFTASLHPDAHRIAITHVDEGGISRAYVHDLGAGTMTRWAGPEAGRAEGSGPAHGGAETARLVRYPTFDDVDGEPRRISAFVYPGRGDGRRPVVVDIHGGPEAQARLRTGEGALQKAGITVITPNVRGSTGYGKTFASLDDQYLREDAVRDIGALLDWIGEQPDMDPGRVAVTGGSYGGYMVLASLVHYSPRLACGIDIVGVSNFVTFLENTADYRRDLRRAEYGDERIPEMREFLESISPLTHAERITSPLMVIQGANDPRVPVGESRQLVDRVGANGLDVAYMEGSNEGHGFRHPWNAFYAGVAKQQRLRECLLGS